MYTLFEVLMCDDVTHRARAFGLGGCDVREVLYHFLGVLRLAGTGLAGTQDGLVLAICYTRNMYYANHPTAFILAFKQFG